MYDVTPTLANHLRKNPAMNSLTDNLAFRISKVNIVSGKNKRYLSSGNFVTTMKLPNPSSFSSSSSSSSSLSSSSSAAKLVRRRTYAPTGFSAERDQKQKQQPSSLMAASDPDAKVDRIAGIASAIRVIPNFPKPGVMFQDITTLLLDPKAFKDTIDLLVERYRGKGISVVAGIEARGFIFGPPIALAIGAKFVPMRKPNKLPGEVISEEYSLEYGTDKIEMHVGAVQAGECALVVDDLIATGGTLCAAIRLLERVGVHVVECACIIELPDLKGRERLGDKPLFVLVSSV